AAVEAKHEYIDWNEIGTEILPLQPFSFPAIDVTACDRMPDGVVIGIDRGDRRACRVEGISAGESNWALIGVPPIVCALLSDVDLLPTILADVGDVEGAERPVEARAPGIAQAVREDFFVGARRAHDRLGGGFVIVEPGMA